MLIWWVADDIVNNSDPYYPNHPWWELTSTSLVMVFTQVRERESVCLFVPNSCTDVKLRTMQFN